MIFLFYLLSKCVGLYVYWSLPQSNNHEFKQELIWHWGARFSIPFINSMTGYYWLYIHYHFEPTSKNKYKFLCKYLLSRTVQKYDYLKSKMLFYLIKMLASQWYRGNIKKHRVLSFFLGLMKEKVIGNKIMVKSSINIKILNNQMRILQFRVFAFWLNHSKESSYLYPQWPIHS